MNEGTSDRRQYMASLELQGLGVNAPSDYRQKRHAAHRRSLVLSCRPGYPGAEIVLEQPSAKPKCGICDARPGDGGLLDSRPVSHLVRGPAHSGVGGVGWNSEASRQEPGALESAQGRAGGAR